ncbi:hypothetical protein DFP93_106126 [Aneurinibacillus soli]|uniref:Uncharacterized protein n=1 Tax=Aneurinibacillus soli TaxID=1500254 RepID=A0A0U5B197_9BACL|nr:YlaF family protein [Aneurinibacillus soli]PYE61933.1 hypothetical protein DFP93_106126 [Aneurinibacillus soli]BAU29749.1 hypothetical protein CB4_03986 [Aneurinibacillus soli]
MTTYQKQSLLIAILGVASLMGVGISFAERNFLMAIVCTIIAILVIGIGFMNKAKHRKNGTL